MSRQATSLTESLVKKISKTIPLNSNGMPVTRKKYFDGVVEGLYFMVLVLRNSQLRSVWGYRQQKTKDQEAFDKKIGDYPEMNLADARVEASRLRTEAMNGSRGVIKRNKTSVLQASSVKLTLAEAANMWFDHARKTHAYKKDIYVLKEKQRFTKNVLQFIGDRPLNDLALDDVVYAFRFCWDREATTSRALATLRKVLIYAINRKICGIEKLSLVNYTFLSFELGKRASSESPRPALGVEEIPSFMKALREHLGINFRFLEFQILCALRLANVRTLKWHQVFLKQAPEVSYLLYPNEELKIAGNGNLKIPLSDRAVEIIQEMMPRRNVGFPKNCQFVFPSERQSHMPLSDAAPTLAIRKMHEEKLAIDGIGWIDPVATELAIARGADETIRISAHGTARSTFRTWASRNPNYRSKPIELCLHHRTGSKVENAYDRYDYFDERVTILNDWCRFCSSKDT